jgi:Transposase
VPLSPHRSLALGACRRVPHCCLEDAIPPLNPLLAPAGSPPGICPSGRTNGDGRDHRRAGRADRAVAALDIGKATLTACIRVPHEGKPGARRQQVRTYATLIPALLELRDWLICQGVTLVVMEATSAYWKPPFYLLEDDMACQVVNARDVKNVPGRPETDKLDAVWLCKLAERGMLRPSFIPSRPQHQLRGPDPLPEALTGTSPITTPSCWA